MKEIGELNEIVKSFGLTPQQIVDAWIKDGSIVIKDLRPQKTSNGYEIYYDESSGEAVGIIYKNLVFLKKTSEKKLDWYDAVDYCKTVVINGMISELCPVSGNWKQEFAKIHKDLYDALAEIGAKNLNYPTWSSSEFGKHYAWLQRLCDGYIYDFDRYGHFYVRPVLVLRR